MLTILLVIVLLAVFVFGLFVLFKGEYKVSNENTLSGGGARLIGVLFALSPIFSFVFAVIIYIALIPLGIDLAGDDMGSKLASLVAMAIPLLLILYLANKLAGRLYAKQSCSDTNST